MGLPVIHAFYSVRLGYKKCGELTRRLSVADSPEQRK
jgi:hypothetical protein